MAVFDYAAQKLGQGITSMPDYLKLEEEFQLKKQLSQAQTLAEQKKLTQLDVDKLGEQAFMKSAMGQPLTPEEQAAAMFIDAKSGGISFNPVTGEMMQKPRLSDRIGLPGMTPKVGGSIPSGGIGEMSAEDVAMIPAMDGSLLGMDGGDSSYGVPPAPQIADPYEKAYKENLAMSKGNPKLQQQITADYMKSRADNQMKVKDDQDKFNRAAQVKAAALEEINKLIGIEGNPNYPGNISGVKRVSGPLGKRIPVVFSNKAADAEAGLEALKNLLTVENLGLLKGVLSDTDMKILANIGSGSISGSDERVIAALKKMQTALGEQSSQAAPYISAEPGQTPIMSGLGRGQTPGDDVQSLIDRYAQ